MHSLYKNERSLNPQANFEEVRRVQNDPNFMKAISTFFEESTGQEPKAQWTQSHAGGDLATIQEVDDEWKYGTNATIENFLPKFFL